MRIGREVDRQIVFDVTSVSIQLRQETAPERFVHAIAGEVIHPDPGQRAKRDLQRAGPINAVLERIFSNPVFPLLYECLEKFTPAGKESGLSEEHEILMPIQFPDELVIPDSSEV